MANPEEDICLSHPNFAVICSFLDRYGEMLGLSDVSYTHLQEWIEDAKNVHPALIDIHVRLLRRIHKKLSNVTADRWERGVVKFCYKYSDVDAWEIERFGYKLAKVSTKLTLLKNLLESQFDCNNKFKDKVNEAQPEDMRFKSVGRDKNGISYWYMLDKELNLRVYREDQDDVDSETWELVCRNRDDLTTLISNLENGTDTRLMKTESPYMSDVSFKSEPGSDSNEDSRESFKQKTPVGPSPLTVKLEPADSECKSTDTKPPIKLKISKAEIDSPSKRLKDKFEKEKGSKLKKIKCKLKEECVDVIQKADKSEGGEEADVRDDKEAESGEEVDKGDEKEESGEEADVGNDIEAESGDTPESGKDEVDGGGDETEEMKDDPSCEKNEENNIKEKSQMDVEKQIENLLEDKKTESELGKAEEKTCNMAQSIQEISEENATIETSNVKLKQHENSEEPVSKSDISNVTEAKSKSGECTETTKAIKTEKYVGSDCEPEESQICKEGESLQNDKTIDELNLKDNTDNKVKKKEIESCENIDKEKSDAKSEHSCLEDDSKETSAMDEDNSLKDKNEDTSNGDSKKLAEIPQDRSEHQNIDDAKCDQSAESEMPKEKTELTIDTNLESVENKKDDTSVTNTGESKIVDKEIDDGKTESQEETTEGADAENIPSKKTVERNLNTEDSAKEKTESDGICLDSEEQELSPVNRNKENVELNEDSKCAKKDTVVNHKENTMLEKKENESCGTVEHKISNVNSDHKCATEEPNTAEKTNLTQNKSPEQLEISNENVSLEKKDTAGEQIENVAKDNMLTPNIETTKNPSTRTVEKDSKSSLDVKNERKDSKENNSVNEASDQTETSKTEITDPKGIPKHDKGEKDTNSEENIKKDSVTAEKDSTTASEHNGMVSKEKQNSETEQSLVADTSSPKETQPEKNQTEGTEDAKTPDTAAKKDIDITPVNEEKDNSTANEQKGSGTEEKQVVETEQSPVADTSSPKGSQLEKTETKGIEDATKTDTAEKKDTDITPVTEEKDNITADEQKGTVTGETEMSPVTDISSPKETQSEKDETKDTKDAKKPDTAGKIDKDITPSRKRKQNQLQSRETTESTTEEEEPECKNINIETRKTKAAVRKGTIKDGTIEEKDNDDKTDNKTKSIDKELKAEDEKVDTKLEKQANEKTNTNKSKKRPARVTNKKGAKNKTKKNEVSEIEEETDKGSTDSENEVKPPIQVRGLIAHSRIGRAKAQKRQADDSPDEAPDEPPASKRSKVRGRVTARGRGKRRVTVSEPGSSESSSTDNEDVPLCKMAGKGKGSNSRGRGGTVASQKNAVTPRKSMRPVKKKKFESDEEVSTPSKIKPVEKISEPNDLDLSAEEDTGRRRSLRVRTLRARKQKSPSPDYIPSELEVDEEDLYDANDDEFNVKSKKRKKREPKFVEEEIPKGRNALRFEAKTSKKGKKVEEVQEDETPCCKCLQSEQPEWILLCDKCDAGYHTACLRPPLMIVPDGDWFCPPCEQTMLLEKLLENLKTLEQSILKNDRLVRRKERLAFVTISLDNVLKEPEPEVVVKKTEKNSESESDTEIGSSRMSESSLSSRSESDFSDDDERHHKSKPRFIQRTCRSKNPISYKFEEFDEMIADAIEEDLSIPKEPRPRKIKPPGISRGKDMSNILGASDEENKPQLKPKKRRPRLTELDEEGDDDDDDTDDYQLSDASAVSDASKSSDTYVSEEVSDDSVAKKCRSRSRRKPLRRRGRGHSRRYREDFVVESDFESEDNDTQQTTRRSVRRRNVNYREIDSDETEVENDNSDSFHTSDLDSDSDGKQRKSKKGRDKGRRENEGERPRSGKRQRIKKVSSESSDDSSDELPSKKKGKKPPRKSARYDSEETGTEESEEEEKPRRGRNVSRRKPIIDDSATEEEAVDTSSSTEVSADEKDRKNEIQKKKPVIRSESEEEAGEEEENIVDEKKEHFDTSRETHSEDSDNNEDWEEMGAEEIHGVEGSEKDDTRKMDMGKVKSPKGKGVNKESPKGKGKNISPKDKVVKKIVLEEDNQNVEKKTSTDSEKIEEKENSVAVKVSDETKEQDSKADTEKADVSMKSDDGVENPEQLHSEEEKLHSNMEQTDTEKRSGVETTPEVTPVKKKRCHKPKTDQTGSETTTPEVTPKKRGRKPKPKPDPSETEPGTQGEEAPVKKKRGRKPKALVTETTNVPETKPAETDVKLEGNRENADTANKLDNDSRNDKEELGQTDRKDDSPLSARNKQNTPVGVVKPEVRQGVIVENKQVMDNRTTDNRGGGEGMVSPLQGMKEMAMGSQMMPGPDQGGFRPYPPTSYPNRNVDGYMGQQGFQNYHQEGPYGPGPAGPGHNPPFQGPMQQGSQGMPQGPMNQSGNMGPGPHPQYPQNMPGPMSSDSYHQHNQYMSPNMQQVHQQGYYSGHYGPQMGPGGPQGPQGGGYGGYGPQGPIHGPQSPNYQGPYPQNYHPQQGGPYHSPSGQGPYPSQQGPHAMGPRPHAMGVGPHAMGTGPPATAPHAMGPGPRAMGPAPRAMGPGPQGQMPPDQQGPPYQRMPYNYPHMPQPRHPPGFGPNQLQVPSSPGLSPEPSQRHVRPPVPAQGDHIPPQAPINNPRVQGAGPRGFMMDNILKTAPPVPERSTSEQREENPDEVEDIVKYITHDKYFKEH